MIQKRCDLLLKGGTVLTLDARDTIIADGAIVAHCIHVNENDYDRLGRAGVAMAYTPIGNAKTGRIAPAIELADAGIDITLCTDTFSGDLFEAMRWAIATQRIRAGGRSVLDARVALRWATETGDGVCSSMEPVVRTCGM